MVCVSGGWYGVLQGGRLIRVQGSSSLEDKAVEQSGVHENIQDGGESGTNNLFSFVH